MSDLREFWNTVSIQVCNKLLLNITCHGNELPTCDTVELVQEFLNITSWIVDSSELHGIFTRLSSTFKCGYHIRVLKYLLHWSIYHSSIQWRCWNVQHGLLEKPEPGTILCLPPSCSHNGSLFFREQYLSKKPAASASLLNFCFC